MHQLNSNEMTYWNSVEEALCSLPLEAPPPDLYINVMSQIQTLPFSATLPKPKFQIFSWLDAAICLFGSLMFSMMMMAGWLFPSYIRPTIYWVFQIINYPVVKIPLIGAVMVSLIGVMLVLILPSGIVPRHRRA